MMMTTLVLSVIAMIIMLSAFLMITGYISGNNNALAQVPNNQTATEAGITIKLSPIPESNITQIQHLDQRDQVLYGLTDKRTNGAFAQLFLYECINSLVIPNYNVTNIIHYHPTTACESFIPMSLAAHIFDVDPPIVTELAKEYLKARGIL